MEPPSPISQVDETSPVAEMVLPAEPEILLTAEDVAGWRDELSDRLSRYRERRKAPPPRYPSLRLPFDPIEARGSALHLPESALIPTFEPLSNHALALDGMQGDAITDEQMALPAEQVEETGPRRESAPHPTAKIIEFPRSAWAPPPPPPDQLAEPVGEQLRILEVPDVAPPLPALGGITIEPTERVEAEKFPFRVLPWDGGSSLRWWMEWSWRRRRPCLDLSFGRSLRSVRRGCKSLPLQRLFSAHSGPHINIC